MKHIYTLSFILTLSGSLSAQQPNNGGFEDWQNTGSDTEEPTDWNGMMTGDLCGFCAFGASQRVFRESNEVYSGTYSARIESTNAIGGIIVNGTMTTGKVTAPSTTPSQGYNQTLTSNSDFNHPFIYEPDSVVFWAKYNVTDASDSARVSFVLHDDYNLRDPQDGNSESHVIGQARTNFQTGNDWERISIPFQYDGASTEPVSYLLGTFTSSYVPGSGSSSATLYLDDLEFVYNTVTQVDEPTVPSVSVYPNPSNNGTFMVSFEGMSEPINVRVYDMQGRLVIEEYHNTLYSLPIELREKGIFIISAIAEDGETLQKRLISQ